MKADTLDVLHHGIPDDVLRLLGKPPLLSNEDGDRYYAMIGFFAKSIRPADLIAWMLVKDLTDHRVEIDRYRRLKVALLERAARTEMSRYVSRLESSFSETQANLMQDARQQKEEFAKQNSNAEAVAPKSAEIDVALAAAMAKAKADTKNMIDAANSHEPTDHEFVAITRLGGIESLERLDALLRSAEDRFVATVYEISHHLADLGARFREELEQEARKVIDIVPAEGSRPNPAGKAGPTGLALSDRRNLKAPRRARGGR